MSDGAAGAREAGRAAPAGRPAEPRRTRWPWWIGGGAAAIVLLDWLTKAWVRSSVELHTSVPVIEGWLHLVHRRNVGIAFGMLGGGEAGPGRTIALAVVAILAVFLLLRLAGEATDRLVRMAVALMLGGAIGNLGDRILDGGVTDFIAVRYFPYIFNVADAAITVGAILLILSIIREPRQRAGAEA
jgi:signal peptidase II